MTDATPGDARRDPLVDGDDLRRGWGTTKTAQVELGDRPGLQVGRVDGHTVHADESEAAGGQDEWPTPLAYLALAAGWCVLAQVERYAAMKRVEISAARCRVEIDFSLSGSVLRGDVLAGCDGVRTHIEIDSPDTADAVAEVVALARRGCFVEQLILSPVDVGGSLTVNGATVEHPPTRPGG